MVQEDSVDVQAIQSKQEEAFAIHTQERIMGLLGAMIPREEKVGLIRIVRKRYSSCIFMPQA